MSIIKQFLRENSLKNLDSIEAMKNPFKTYKPLDKGNSKLHKGILSFSLLPVVTCNTFCKGCYDVKSLRYQGVRDKRQYNTWLTLREPEALKQMIIKQIKNSRTVKFVRIHVGGDFYSSEYVNFWAEIALWMADNKPNVKLYTYTKTEHLDTLKAMGINVVDSLLPGGGANFDTKEKLFDIQSKNKEYTICPATLKEEGIICGLTCTVCMEKSKVLFVKH
jgi:hypothetical protein